MLMKRRYYIHKCDARGRKRESAHSEVINPANSQVWLGKKTWKFYANGGKQRKLKAKLADRTTHAVTTDILQRLVKYPLMPGAFLSQRLPLLRLHWPLWGHRPPWHHIYTFSSGPQWCLCTASLWIGSLQSTLPCCGDTGCSLFWLLLNYRKLNRSCAAAIVRLHGGQKQTEKHYWNSFLSATVLQTTQLHRRKQDLPVMRGWSRWTEL